MQRAASSMNKPLVAVIRMSSIGDIIMTKQAQENLISQGFEPILVCDKKFMDAKVCFPSLKWIACWHADTGFDVFDRDLNSQKWERTIQNQQRIYGILDLQNTARSRKVIAALKSTADHNRIFTIEKNAVFWKTNKHTFFRIWLVISSFLRAFFTRKSWLKSTQFKRDFLINACKTEGLVTTHQQRAVDEFCSQLKSQFFKSFENGLTPSDASKPVQWVQQNPEGFDSEFWIKSSYICVFPGASSMTKLWPKEHFRNLIELILNQTSHSIVLCGSELERSLGVYLDFPQNPRVINKIGELALGDTLTLLKSASGFVSNDSFPGHAAQHFDTPGVVIFGSTTPHFGFQPHSSYISSLWTGLPCSPCSRHGSNKCRYLDLACLKSLSAEAVFSVLLKNLNIKVTDLNSIL
jgi:heptosyltransferase II